MVRGCKRFIQIFIDVVLWLGVCFCLMFLFLRGKPVERGFVCNDPALSYPYVPDTIPPRVLMIAGFVLPAFVMVLVEILNSIETHCSPCCQSTVSIIYCVKGYAVFLVGFVVQETVVNSLKNELGVLRPDFFDVCKPEFNKSLCPGYIENFTCGAENITTEILLDVRRSFPSENCAFSMYIAAYFCFYIERRLQVTFSRTLKFFLQIGLLFISLSCGLESIQENKHHIHDVIVGFLVGIAVAVGVYTSVMDNPKEQLCRKCHNKIQRERNERVKKQEHTKALRQTVAVHGTNIYLSGRFQSAEHNYEFS